MAVTKGTYVYIKWGVSTCKWSRTTLTAWCFTFLHCSTQWLNNNDTNFLTAGNDASKSITAPTGNSMSTSRELIACLALSLLSMNHLAQSCTIVNNHLLQLVTVTPVRRRIDPLSPPLGTSSHVQTSFLQWYWLMCSDYSAHHAIQIEIFDVLMKT